MALALVPPDSTISWMYVAGAVTGANALFNGTIIFLHPAFRRGDVSLGSDPWASKSKAADGSVVGAATLEDSMVAYLRAHPELAARAATTAATATITLGAAAAAPAARASMAARPSAAPGAPEPSAQLNPFRAVMQAQAAGAAAGPGASRAADAGYHIGSSVRGDGAFGEGANPFQ